MLPISYQFSKIVQIAVRKLLEAQYLIQLDNSEQDFHKGFAALQVPASILEGSLFFPDLSTSQIEVSLNLASESDYLKLYQIKKTPELTAQDDPILILETWLDLIRRLGCQEGLLTPNECFLELKRIFDLSDRDQFKAYEDLVHECLVPKELRFDEKGEKASPREWEWIEGVRKPLKKLELEKTLEEREETAKKAKKGKAEKLIELGLEIGSYFKGADGENYCTIGTETFKVASQAFKAKLYKAFYERYEEGLTSEAWSNGRVVLEAQCDEGEPIPVYLRTAYKDSSVTVDLGQQYIHIDKDGFHSQETTSLKFLRPASSQALPVPTREIQDLPTALDRLGNLVNLPPESLRLLLAWMTFSYIEGLPKPLLCFTGTHGSGKSTVSRLVKDLLDPDSLGLGTTPNDSRNLAIACQKRWLLAFDNSSGFSNEVSDTFCRVITGAGFSARTLYSDGEETIFSFKRPVLLNGIGDFINRPDLLDRSMILELDLLEERLSERQLQDAINQIKPDLLGFLFTSISNALPIFETLDDYQYNLPRMADFGLWLVAIEKAWGLADGLLLNTFNGNQSRSSEIALETSPVALAIFKLFEGGRTYWEGTTQELLDYFLKSDIFATLVKAKDFPKTVHGLRTQLTLLTPDLAKQGFEIEKVRVGKAGTRQIKIRKLKEIEIIDKVSSVSSANPELLQSKLFEADDTADDTDGTRI